MMKDNNIELNDMDDYLDLYVDFKGMEYKVTEKTHNNHYKLIATGEDYDVTYPLIVVATPMKCPACLNTFWYDDKNILCGEKYECKCPNCNTFVKIRKEEMNE